MKTDKPTMWDRYVRLRDVCQFGQYQAMEELVKEERAAAVKEERLAIKGLIHEAAESMDIEGKVDSAALEDVTNAILAALKRRSRGEAERHE